MKCFLPKLLARYCRITSFSKRKIQINLLIAFIFSNAVFSQNDFSKTEEEIGWYGKGGKKEIKIFKYSDGGKDTIIRYFDPKGRLRYYVQTTVEKDGTTTDERSLYNCEGHKKKTEIIKRDSAETLLYHLEEEYDGGKNNNIIKGSIFNKREDGSTGKKEFNEDSRKYDTLIDVIIPDEWRGPFLQPDPSACPLEEEPRMEFFAGYSHLLADFQPEREGLHGWAASAFYNFSPRWSAGLTFSQHNKSPENQKFSISFLHVGLKYDFVKRDEASRRFNPYAWMAIGTSFYKSEVNVPGVGKFESDDKSFCPGIGAGFDWELLKKLYLNADVSYVPTRFDGQTQHNASASVGITAVIFRTQRSFVQ